MVKIDTASWKDFKIGEIFPVIVKPPVLHSKEVVENQNGIPYVVRTKFNNGIKCRVQKADNMQPSPPYVISFGAENATFFYQEEEFVSGRDIYYIKIPPISKNAALFITTCLQKIAEKYSYNYGMFPDLIKEDVIKLPVQTNGEPDFQYMDEYMQKIIMESKASLRNLRLSDKAKHLTPLKHWRNIRIGDLFKIIKGTRLTKADMKPGNIKFIGSSAMNNGLTAMICNDKNLHSANTITVCYNGSVGETFYQDQPFWASDDVNVLYPKFNLNKNIALFIAPIIKAVSHKYSFNDKWKLEDMTNAKIKLPTTKSGDPDWEYMNNYMENVLKQSRANLQNLSKVI